MPTCWRNCSSHSEASRAVPSPVMSHSSLEPLHLREQASSEISQIASLWHKPPNSWTEQTNFACKSISSRFHAARKSQPIQSLHFCNLLECLESVYGSFTVFLILTAAKWAKTITEMTTPNQLRVRIWYSECCRHKELWSTAARLLLWESCHHP